MGSPSLSHNFLGVVSLLVRLPFAANAFPSMPVDTALLRASVIYNESTVPANLAVGRMLRGPLVPLGAAAFTARSEEEALLATFATWNMLDAIMFERSRLIRDRKNGSMSVNVGRAHSWQTGYVREVQVRRMVQLVREPNVATTARWA